MRVRPTAVAGRFYPDDPAELRGSVEGFLDFAPAWTGPPPRALVAPHAGNIGYLRTKQTKLGHLLSGLQGAG